MERDGYESDLNRLFVMNLETKEKRFLSRAFQSNVDTFAWSSDCSKIFFIGPWHGVTHIYSLDLADNSVHQLTKGVFNYNSLSLLQNRLIASRVSMSAAAEFYSVDTETGEAIRLSFFTKNIFDQIDLGQVEESWVETTDHKQMLVWIIFPPDFDASKKYPALLYCQGGPQSMVGQFWSLRWNLQLMAANGYIVVAPNRRGLPGFGVEWNENISGDYGGQCMKDYFSAIDSVSSRPYIDETRLGCVGASFGGFSVYWMAGNHEKRFKAFVAHAGMFNCESFYLETEELWFPQWDLKGPPWERKYDFSPHLSLRSGIHQFFVHMERKIIGSATIIQFKHFKQLGLEVFQLVF